MAANIIIICFNPPMNFHCIIHKRYGQTTSCKCVVSIANEVKIRSRSFPTGFKIFAQQLGLSCLETLLCHCSVFIEGRRILQSTFILFYRDVLSMHEQPGFIVCVCDTITLIKIGQHI